MTWCPETEKYILCAGDLRRLNEYLDTIAETIEPPLKTARANGKNNKITGKNSGAVAEGISKLIIPAQDGKRRRTKYVL